MPAMPVTVATTPRKRRSAAAASPVRIGTR
jgi:hypothetical protein